MITVIARCPSRLLKKGYDPRNHTKQREATRKKNALRVISRYFVSLRGSYPFFSSLLGSKDFISIEAGAVVRLIQQLDWVANAEIHFGESRARSNLHVTSRVPGGQHFGARLFNVLQFFRQHLL